MIQGSSCPPKPAQQVPVELRDGDRVVVSTTTDADGHYQLSAPAGDFDVVATNIGGYQSQDSEPVHLDAGDDIEVDLQLDSGIR
jgi:hypothetical protein